MKVINVRNVNEALSKGLELIYSDGVHMQSRNGSTIEVPEPVATVYNYPWERVLINRERDANPFFHMFEALWILAGRDDVKFLTEFNKRMAEFSDNGVDFNAPYGYRMRTNFLDAGNCNIDQVQAVIEVLKQDPNSRQAVVQIWDVADLEKQTKDKACNMQVVFRIREGNQLDTTVYNRSNDMLWGAYGANVVQFSMLQEYVAAHLDGVVLGTYTQVSNAFHVYLDGPGGKLFERMSKTYEDSQAYEYQVHNMVYMEPYDIEAIEIDIKHMFSLYDFGGLEALELATDWSSFYFKQLVLPMLGTFILYKRNGAEVALKSTSNIIADDWRIACEHWLQNRLAKGK